MAICSVKPLTPDRLYQPCDPAQFEFQTTTELPDLHEVIGQDRAVGAVRFGVGIRSQGYNMYALGPSGTGKATTIKQFLAQQVANQPVPDDWCYVNNFEAPHRPIALRLPPGRGAELRRDVERLIDDLKTAIPRAFESEEYEREREAII
ncbi:MAG TPA: ATP-dependent protease, partial [Anaerolineae bacterium]|nr:ATP-dependent protease [Anaerolineae bacterium]